MDRSGSYLPLYSNMRQASFQGIHDNDIAQASLASFSGGEAFGAPSGKFFNSGIFYLFVLRMLTYRIADQGTLDNLEDSDIQMSDDFTSPQMINNDVLAPANNNGLINPFGIDITGSGLHSSFKAGPSRDNQDRGHGASLGSYGMSANSLHMLFWYLLTWTIGQSNVPVSLLDSGPRKSLIL